MYSHKIKENNYCKLLLITAYLYILAYFSLNIYIIYKIIYFFYQDSWTFLAGILLFAPFPITGALLFLSIYSIKFIYKNHVFPYIYYLIISLVNLLIGLILNNTTTFLWIFIVIFSFFAITSVIICVYTGKRKENVEEEKNNGKKSFNYNFLKWFQLFTVILLFLTAIINSVYDNRYSLNSYYLISFINIFLFVINFFVYIGIIKKRKLALQFLFIEYIILTVLLGLLFIAFLITEKFGKDFFIALTFFIIIGTLFLFIIKICKKLLSVSGDGG